MEFGITGIHVRTDGDEDPVPEGNITVIQMKLDPQRTSHTRYQIASRDGPDIRQIPGTAGHYILYPNHTTGYGANTHFPALDIK